MLISGGPGLVGALLLAVLGQVAHELSGTGNCFNVVAENSVGNTGDLGVHLSSAEFLLCHSFVGNSLNDFRTSDKHIAAVLNHEDEISKSR